MSQALFGHVGYIAASQLLLILIYVGCGAGKMGPWFACVFASEWTVPPWFSGSKFMSRLFYKQTHDDKQPNQYQLTDFAYTMGYAAAVTEWAAPLLLFITEDFLGQLGLPKTNLICYFGVITLVAMHIYSYNIMEFA